MEKLIELLNEYEKKRIEKINSEGKLIMKLSFNPYTEESLTNKAYRSCWLEICSKYYGFIGCLVENDKINTNELEKIGYEKTVYMYDGQYREIVEYSDYEALLMLLSIQDEPIEFLISILR